MTYFVIGNARTGSDNPITHQYSAFYIAFEVDEKGVILRSQASVTLDLTRDYLQELFQGRSLAQCDQQLIELIQSHYLGSSQKAVIVAYQDACRRFATHILSN